MTRLRETFAACALAALSSAACAQTYHAVPLPAGVGSVNAVSPCGWVMGIASETQHNTYVFLNGFFQMLPTYDFYGQAVNDYGDVAGYLNPRKGPTRSTAALNLFGAAQAQTIYRTYGVFSQAYGINEAGVAVGSAAPLASPGNFNPFVYADGKITQLKRRTHQTLAGINNRNQIVGTELDGDVERVFTYDGSYHFLPLPGVAQSQGKAINDAGVVVGNVVMQDGLAQGFVYADGVTTFTGPGPEPFTNSIGLAAVNNGGQAVGTMYGVSGSHAVLFSDGRLIDLNDVSDAPEPLAYAVGISDGGLIAVSGALNGHYVLVPGGVYPPNTCKTR